MTNKLYIAFNVCEISRQNNCDTYIEGITSIVDQPFFKSNCKLVISGCGMTTRTKERLEKAFGSEASFSWVEDHVPISITFNLAILKMVEKFGAAEGYLYIDSGIRFLRYNDLENLYKRLRDDIGIVGAITTTDCGFHQWFGIEERPENNDKVNELFKDEELILPIGKALNLHCQIFSNKLFEYYGKLCPDIFSGYCLESTFSSLCTALRAKWIITNEVIVEHRYGMDVGSSCSQPVRWKAIGKKDYDHPFVIPSILDRIQGGEQYGLFYEACQGIMLGDMAQYDENGICTNDQLKEFIKDKLFLHKDEFDYNSLTCEFK